MLNNFIYAKKKVAFERALDKGEVLDESIVFIEDTKEIWNHGTYFAGTSDLVQMLNYQDLKNLKENNKLVPGKFYCITDYTAITKQNETTSAGNVFGIVIQATSNNTFSHDASAVAVNDNFDGNLLDAWVIKYDFNNDTNRYAWADPDNGKGVIYYMKDEFNNECPYDFKNIMFIRYKLDAPEIDGYSFEYHNRMAQNIY